MRISLDLDFVVGVGSDPAISIEISDAALGLILSDSGIVLTFIKQNQYNAKFEFI